MILDLGLWFHGIFFGENVAQSAYHDPLSSAWVNLTEFFVGRRFDEIFLAWMPWICDRFAWYGPSLRSVLTDFSLAMRLPPARRFDEIFGKNRSALIQAYLMIWAQSRTR